MKRAVAYLEPYMEAEKTERSVGGANRHGDGERRRPRHRQEHRRRRPRLQRLRGDRPRRHGPRRPDPGRRRRAGLRHRRPLGPHHAVARRDGLGREGDGAARARAAAADRRRDDVEAAHRRAHRARVRPADGARARCVARGRRGRRAARRRQAGAARRREPGGSGPPPRAARREGPQAVALAARGTNAQDADRLAWQTTSPRRRSRARASWRKTSRPFAGTSTGRSSSMPGSSRGGIRRSSTIRRRARSRGSSSPMPTSCSTRSSQPGRSRRAASTASGRRSRRATTSSWTELGFPMLRQQADHADSRPNRSLADYVAPVETGLADHVGAFAVAIHGSEALADVFAAELDDYRAIMVRALADRLAEAFAERLHEIARHEWYAPAESLSNEERIGERFRGIRPAYGYPACPDHSEKGRLLELLEAPRAGIGLTDSFATTPAASVSGLYFGHPQARYFSVGRLGRDQVVDYAAAEGHRRRGGRALAASEPRVRAVIHAESARQGGRRRRAKSSADRGSAGADPRSRRSLKASASPPRSFPRMSCLDTAGTAVVGIENWC